jgi:hypothetical protein
MTIENVDRTVVTQGGAVPGQDIAPAVASRETLRTTSQQVTTARPARPELARRIIVLVFGLVQILIAARFVLLLLDAREANGLVSGILNFSQLFVAPFEGILRSNSLHAAGSVLDIAAVLAFVGWTIVELIVIWAIGIFRREPA